jgi:hypothetical protein
MSKDRSIGSEETLGEATGGRFFGVIFSESGFFRIRMYKFNLGIENGCTWGDPLLEEQFE